jgi:hypothetical protein
MQYFKTFFPCIFVAFFAWTSVAEALHFRLTETSITENGQVRSEPGLSLKTKGYGAAWIFPIGLGLGYTQLETTGSENGNTVELNHSYLDATFTSGQSWLATFGYSVGVAGDVKINGESSKKFRASSYTLGAGYRFSAFEIYWVNRLNFPRYEMGQGTLNVTSTHYQLVLGLYLP